MDNTITQEGFPTLDNYVGEKEDEQLALFNLQDLAVSNTNTIASLQDKLKNAQEMLDSSFKSSEVFIEEEKRSREQALKLKNIKNEIRRQPTVIELESTVKEIKNEIKETKVEVTSYAMEVFRRTGVTEFEREGEVFEIQTNAKLVRRKQ